MQLTRISRKNFLLVAFAFTVVFLSTRFPKIASDEINPDGVNWHYRSQQFVLALKTLQLEKTYQHYHPGVMLMWVTGVPVEIFKQISGITVYDQYNFQSFQLVTKISLVIAQLILSVLIIYLLEQIIGLKKSIMVVGLFSMEPFFLGNSRLYHMDVLFTLFMIVALLLFYLAVETKKTILFMLSGVFASFSFLTKSVGIGIVFYLLAYIVVIFAIKKDWKKYCKYPLIFVTSFILTSFIFFPALLKNPVYYIGQIFSEAERIGVRSGHEQILFGESTMDAGPSFYPLILLMKLSPFIILGFSAFVLLNFRKFRKQFYGLSFYLFIFYLGYFIFMSIPSKKLDRYMLPIYPFFSYIAVLGFYKLFEVLTPKIKSIYVKSLLGSLAVVFILVPDIQLFPYNFTYTSPLFGTPAQANNIIAQKPFGVGIFQLKSEILKRYGDYPKLGFYDVKPMQAIYPNSKIFDVRVYGPGKYDLLVLAVNEGIPDKVEDNGSFVLVKDYSLYINGLEYWRIYVKKNK